VDFKIEGGNVLSKRAPKPILRAKEFLDQAKDGVLYPTTVLMDRLGYVTVRELRSKHPLLQGYSSKGTKGTGLLWGNKKTIAALRRYKKDQQTK